MTLPKVFSPPFLLFSYSFILQYAMAKEMDVNCNCLLKETTVKCLPKVYMHLQVKYEYMHYLQRMTRGSTSPPFTRGILPARKAVSLYSCCLWSVFSSTMKSVTSPFAVWSEIVQTNSNQCPFHTVYIKYAIFLSHLPERLYRAQQIYCQLPNVRT